MSPKGFAPGDIVGFVKGVIASSSAAGPEACFSIHAVGARTSSGALPGSSTAVAVESHEFWRAVEWYVGHGAMQPLSSTGEEVVCVPNTGAPRTEGVVVPSTVVGEMLEMDGWGEKNEPLPRRDIAEVARGETVVQPVAAWFGYLGLG